ncbi:MULTISPECIES: hypothetical protein [Streptomyces]|uniref:Uncharacterized protein n=1 Tax=Streptomyces stelliscabiei TaxID=146820 RepID=A0A8I0PA26_9ACTN|nr:hypothetical protein IQ64_20210 [Streptomyces stelliscabiei]MBE1602636.1 hypothetical protein [Streptomyces stelliscabiei]SOD65903.1 hypothetical protein SAMN06272781_0408 [Streptomyces sp. 1222.2]
MELAHGRASALTLSGTPVEVILAFYGLYFLIVLPLHRLGARPLAIITAVGALVLPQVLYLVQRALEAAGGPAPPCFPPARAVRRRTGSEDVLRAGATFSDCRVGRGSRGHPFLPVLVLPPVRRLGYNRGAGWPGCPPGRSGWCRAGAERWGVVEDGASQGAAVSTGTRHEGPSGVDGGIAQSAPEVSVVARLAHLQDAAGNAAVVRLLGAGAAADDTLGAPDPAS